MTELTGEWKRIEYMLVNPAFRSGFQMIDGKPMVSDDAAERAQKAIALATSMNQHGKPVLKPAKHVSRRTNDDYAADFDVPDWKR